MKSRLLFASRFLRPLAVRFTDLVAVAVAVVLVPADVVLHAADVLQVVAAAEAVAVATNTRSV